MSSIMTKLPNEIIMNIIRMADGGLNTHKTKMNVIFEQIRGVEAIYWYEDDCVPPNLCSNYFPAIDDSEEDDSESEEEDEENEEQYQCMCDNLCGTRLGINVPIACIYQMKEGRPSWENHPDQTWCQTCWDDLKEEMNEEGWVNDDSSDDSSDDD